MSLKRHYIHSGLVSGGSKIMLALTAFLVIWGINEIAGKEGYGLFAIVFSLYFIIAMGFGSAIRSLLVYKTSKEEDHERDSRSCKMASTLFSLSLALGFCIAGILYLSADWLWTIWEKPELLFWLQSLVLLIPAHMSNFVLTGWYQAQQKISKMVVYMEAIPAVIRLLLLSLAVFFTDKPLLIAVAFIASYAIPTIILYLRQPLPLYFNFKEFEREDFSYGFDSSLNHFVNKSSEHLVIILLGAMTSAIVVAEFALAYRFAQLLMLPKIALGQLLLPRLGNLIHHKQRDQIRAEFDILRFLTTFGVLCGSLVFALIGSWLLGVIGNYESSYGTLLILTAAVLLRNVFGDSGSYLPMAGYVRWGLFTNILGMTTLVSALYAFAPLYGGDGAALAVFFSAIVAMGAKAYGIYKKDQYNTIKSSVFIWAAIAIFALLAHALGTINITAFVALFLLSIFGILTTELKNLRSALKQFI